MPPQYRTPYHYFRCDADEYMKQHRPQWSRDDRANTLATLWAGDATVRTHYTGAANGPGPGLPAANPIPAHPYTIADANQARATRGMPAQAAVAPAPAPFPAAPAPVSVPAALTALEKTQAQGDTEDKDGKQEKKIADLEEELRTLKAAKAAERLIDTYPYSFMPDLPWDPIPEHYKEITTPNEWLRDDLPPVRASGESDVIFSIRQNKWEKLRNQIRLHFVRSSLYKDLKYNAEERTWRSARWLAQGSYGSTGLWTRVDATGTIIDRVVNKEVVPLPHLWKCPDEWRNKVPREIRMHQLIDSTRQPTSHLNVIRHRGYRLLMNYRRYKIYTDFCDGGPLWDAMRERWSTKPRHFTTEKSPEFEPLKVLPETYVWYLFSGLVNACLVLEQGREYEQVEGWKPLVHNDLHVMNVLLGKDPDNLPCPHIILMDFGRTFYELNPGREPAHLEESDNPLIYRLPSCDTRFPPELQPGSDELIKITSKADVWSIGMLMYAIMSHHYPSKGPWVNLSTPQFVNAGPYNDVDLLFDGDRYPVADHENGAYKGCHDLFNLVSHCLSHEPGDRPTLMELKEVINQNLMPLSLADCDPELDMQDQFDEFAIGRKHRNPE